MNIREGSHRIQRIGKAALIFAAILFAIVALATLVSSALHQRIEFEFLPMMALLTIYPAFLGGLFWMLGWIIEGFASSPDDHPPTESPSNHAPDRL